MRSCLDMWSREHAEPFDCVDVTNDSKLLVTTRFAADQSCDCEMTCHSLRIKGILDKGHEVVRSAQCVFCFVSLFVCFVPQELELLSVRESVELLSAVAQLDTSEVSPCMIELVRQHAVIAAADDLSCVTDCCHVCVRVVSGSALWALAALSEYRGQSCAHLRW